MPSKGIDFYGYAAEGFSLDLKAWDAFDTNERSDHLAASSSWQKRSPEINSYVEYKMGFIPIPHTLGRIQFFARQADGSELPGSGVRERTLRVDALSGNIDAEDMRNIMQHSETTPDYCLSFGVYNSDGAHISDLPNRHQVYVSLTQAQHNWQQRLFAAYRQRHQGLLDGLTLSKVALPGSHDAGMYHNLGVQSLTNMANTQRDSIATQLRLGARYFDFRPGRIEPDFENTIRKTGQASGFFGKAWELLKGAGINTISTVLRPFVGQLRHIHLVLPGETYEDFLRQIGEFLQDNPEELVVVRIKYDGFLEGAVSRPEHAELMAMAAGMARQHGLLVGGPADLKAEVKTLLSTHKRLLVLYQEDQFASMQSYNDSDGADPDTNYQSYEAQHILNALNKTNHGIKPDSKTDHADLTKLAWVDAQLQLTATAVAGGATRAIAAMQPATSPLLATKPRTDALTYPWIHDQLQLTEGALVTLCNDFYDNALTEATYQANLRRLGLR